MKKIIAGLVCIFVGASLFAIDLFEYVPLKGAVKSYTMTDYAISSQFGDYFRTPEFRQTHVLENGIEMESSEYTPHDSLVNKVVNTYSNGKLAGQTATDNTGKVLWRSVITYNEKGLIADSSEESADGILKSRTIYTYSEQGQLVDETTYDGNGALVWKITYVYTNNKLSRENHYYADGLLYEAKEFAYNDNGTMATISTLGPIGNAMWREIFRYTDNTLTEITTVDRDNRTIGRKILRYDNSGNLQRVSDYNIAQKFGTTVNELVDMQEYSYEF